jgi:hypothetical protein
MLASLSGSSLGELIPRNVPSCASKRLPFTAAVDDPVRFRRSRDIGAYLGFVRVKAPTLPPPSSRARARARDGSENQRPWPADKVERWAIERLIPYARNAR